VGVADEERVDVVADQAELDAEPDVLGLEVGQLAVEALHHLLQLGVEAHRLAVGQARQLAVLEEDAHELAGGALGLGDEVEPGARRAAHRAGDLQDELEETLDDLVEEVALLVEVEIEGALGDAGGAGEIVDGGAVVALLAEHALRGGDQTGAALVPGRLSLAGHEA
jgi:hypothetical protein